MWFIGDIHGDFGRYNEILTDIADESSFQVGDFGIFNDKDIFDIPRQHKFIRGNHDNPELCRGHENYLGDWNYFKKLEMFWLSGGYSIDHEMRTIGLNWWDDEELKYSEMVRAIEKYRESKPRIMVSHEAPTVIKGEALRANPIDYGKGNLRSRTEDALQGMFDIHRPDVWIYGHYHYPVDVSIGGTRFIGLGDHRRPTEEQIFEIPGLSW